MKLPALLAATAALGLAACSDPAPEPTATGTASPAPAATAAPLPSNAPEPSASTAPLPATFPQAMIGRWGLVPGDCTSKAGDHKGMITISASEIKFYESVAEIRLASQRTDTALRADMAFEGEGMQWTRDVALRVRPAANQLVLEEFGSDAVAGPRTYTRCS